MSDADLQSLRAADLAERDFIVRATDRSLLVEAAAGTGKTTLLVERILHGLREGRLELPKTVAITFTEEAAAELEARLRGALTRELSGRSPQAREPDPGPRRGLGPRRRMEVAAGEIDAANISTIHSFCATLLRMRPAEAGMDPAFQVMDETQAELLREKCWQEWMGEQARSTDSPLTEALRAGITVGGSPGRAGLRDLAETAAGLPEVLDPSYARRKGSARPPGEMLDGFRAGAAEAAGFIRANMQRKGNPQSRALLETAAAAQSAPAGNAPALRRAAYALAAVNVENALKSFRKDVREEATALFGRVQGLARGVGAELAWDLLGWVGGFVGFYGAEKRRRGALDFRDLLLASARMLRTSPPARAFFRTRFDAFFVDEFQDTDPLQAEIIAFLCERPGARPAESWEDVELEDGKLFVVGDPKQSIYRFRRADVQVYERFKDLFRSLRPGGESVRRISQNWRSGRALVGGVNALFERVFQPPARPDVYQAVHVPLVASRDDAAEGPAIIALCPPDPAAEGLGRADSARRMEARCLALAVRELVDGSPPAPIAGALRAGRPLRYGDFACLLRALTSVDAYEEAFEAHGVPYRVIGGKSFYQRQEVGETLCVLRALDDPLDHVSIVGALRSTYFALSDEDLMRYRAAGGRWTYTLPGATEPDGPVAEAMELLAHWHRERTRTAPHRLLRAVWDRTKAREGFLLKPAGGPRVANIEKLLEQLRTLWTASAGSFRGIVDYLALLHERREDEAESSVVEPGDDFAVLLSIHRAKGLEFDAVCLPDLSRGLPGGGAPLILDRIGRRAAVGLGASVRTEMFEELNERERLNLLAEQRRLLYVAATRAGRLLVLPLNWQNAERDCLLGILADGGIACEREEVPFGEERGGVFFWDTRPWAEQFNAAPSPRPAPRAPATKTTAAELVAERARWRSEREALLLRAGAQPPILLPSAMVAGSHGAADPRDLDEGAGRPGGLAFGTLFHNVMRRLPLDELARGEEDGLPALAEGLARMEAAALGLEDAQASEAARLAVDLTQDAEFRALLAGAQHVRREVPFAVPLRALPFFDDDAPGLLEGSIDLVLAGADGTVVLDYKTDRLGPEDAGKLARRYWPQLALYGLALEAAGAASDRAELVLCFVRRGLLLRRDLDEGFVEATGRRVLEAAAQAALAREGE
ncbi:MAG: UvrD-helicase domain-containing protein [Candidatus Brocadiia bacterium]|jgi:ATP-dependent helicase/nuclease subunit A|nr:UvrD-helicase domain-containing protein [Candidatus Brocadiia bacterium]